MTTLSDSQTNGYTFEWKIENLRNSFWLDKEVGLVSPTFTADAFHGTKWSLSLYPMGNEDENFVAFFLQRQDDNGPDVIKVNYHLAFLDKFGSVLNKSDKVYKFQRGHRHGDPRFISRQKVFFTHRDVFLTEDTLTVSCNLFKTAERIFHFKQKYARTVLKVNRKSVLWNITKFSKVQTDMINKFKEDLIDLDLILSNGDFNINMISVDDSIKYLSVNISVIGFGKIRKHCGQYRFDLVPSSFVFGIPKGATHVMSLPGSVMKYKDKFVPNDVLSLDIKYMYSTIINSYEFYDSVMSSPKSAKEVAENYKKHYVKKEESQTVSVLTENLKSMYRDGTFSDAQLHTSSQSFPVHRNILSARSPVFRRMFSRDMKAKNINIPDLEDDIVHRMLLFIYTDAMEDLQLESAAKLYKAADKYEILTLKSKCSSFLKENLCPSKACDVLLLADLHQDQDLKGFVQAYILEHSDVFGLQEWKDFMESNIKLAAEIMYQKLNPCKM